MRVFITGGSGFIGSHLIRSFLGDGHAVGGLVRGLTKLPADAISLVYDGSTKSVVDAMQAFQPDVVVHLASKYLAAHEPKDIEGLVGSNILLGCQILEAMSKGRIGGLVNFGTSFQHYHTVDYNPVSLYAATKQAFEDLARYYVEAHGLRMLTLKLSDTYGPADSRGKIIALLEKAGRTGQDLALSPGQQSVNFVHVDDVIRAVNVAIGRLKVGPGSRMESFAVRGDELLTLRAFVSLFEDISGYQIRAEWGAREYRDREVMDPWLGETLPGWRPSIPLRDGLRQLLAHV
jgi:nucleoside-diphosphate-sugar epimerase